MFVQSLNQQFAVESKSNQMSVWFDMLEFHTVFISASFDELVALWYIRNKMLFFLLGKNII